MTRILYLAKEDKAKVRLAALVLFTLSAPPVIYNGTEVGVSQRNPLGRFEEARLPMPWGDEADKDLLAYFQRLGELRKQFPMLSSGQTRGSSSECSKGNLCLCSDFRNRCCPDCIEYGSAFSNDQCSDFVATNFCERSPQWKSGNRVNGLRKHFTSAQSGALIA